MEPRIVRALFAASAALALLLSACSGMDVDARSGSGPRGGRLGGGPGTRFSLVSFDDCDRLLAHLKGIASAKVGPYGFSDGRYWADGDMVVTDQATRGQVPSSAAPEAGSDVGAGSPDHSGTNNQEVGVDEADTVKSDGRRVVVLRQDTMTVIDVSDAASPRRTARLNLGNGSGSVGNGTLVMEGDRVLLMLERWEQPGPSGKPNAPTSVVGPPSGSDRTVTDLIMVSIVDPAAPEVLDRATVDGSVVAARLVDGKARIVMRSASLGFSWVYASGSESEAAATAANRSIIEASTIDQWLPRFRHGSSERAAVDCADVNVPAAFAGLGMVTIHTLAMTDRIEPRTVGLLADSQTVYASPTHLYVTADEYVDSTRRQDPHFWDELSTSYRTDIHEFDISGDQASYEASGQVRGHPLDQYSLSEADGRFRIATTDGPPWARPTESERVGPSTSESFLTVLEPDGGTLRQVGQVGGMGRGEMIRSVRYDGERAYVVTFRQTDPFYVIDLSDPVAPRLAGELKIPGYSGYLHPLGGGRVLGVGSDATTEGRITGVKVSLFDVSDPASPTELSSWRTQGGSTSVESEAKAFLWWAATDLAVVPVDNWDGSGTGPATGAVGLRVTADRITEVGTVTHERGYPDQMSSVQRSMVVRDRLITLTGHDLLSSDLATLSPGLLVDL